MRPGDGRRDSRKLVGIVREPEELGEGCSGALSGRPTYSRSKAKYVEHVGLQVVELASVVQGCRELERADFSRCSPQDGLKRPTGKPT